MLLATLLCYLGFTALCLSMGRHYETLVGRRLSAARRRWLRLMGWSMLLASLWVAASALSIGQALVQWSAALMASAVVLVFAMSCWPRLALSMAGVGALLVPVAASLQYLA